ncbi:MAG: hypothetical protein WBR15_09445 [Gammaproteobacteria bacterium]
MWRAVIGVMLAMGSVSTALATSPPQSISPIKVLILPADIKIYQLTAANNLDEQPLASTTASTQVVQDAQTFMRGKQEMVPVSMPALNPQEQAMLNEHLALYKVAASTAQTAKQMGGPWDVPFAEFDYTVGPGLQFLKQKTGADVALILIGDDAESTGGHIAMGMFMSLLGVITPSGRNFMTAGLIDLDTGQIRWLDYDAKHAGRDFTNPAVLDEIVDEMLQKYPQGSIHSDNGH